MDKILDYLDAHGCICDNSVAYKTKDFPFTWEEFQLFTEEIWQEAGGWDRSDEYWQEEEYFETYYVPFTKNGKNYFLDIMYGQGSAWSLWTEAEHLEKIKSLENDVNLPIREMSEEKAIDVLRFALAAIWTEGEKDSPNLEDIAIIAGEALKFTYVFASPGKVPSNETGLESWVEFKQRRKLK
jgi:hypothetical protein